MVDGSGDVYWTKVFDRPKTVVARKVAGEFFLIPVSGKLADMRDMYALNAVGEFIWERLDARRSLGDIRDEVLARFGVAREVAEGDIREFLTELAAAGLSAERVS